ncbi:translation initiation factor 4E, partial [Lecanoromycetidae sp. Uapishka_2]
MDNLWQRRSNSSKTTISTADPKEKSKDNTKSENSRPYQPAKRFGGEGSFSSKSNPFNGIAPLATTSVASPTSGASSAFSLGSGAFASFGSSAKTPRTPGTSLDFSNGTPNATSEKREKDSAKENGGADLKPKISSASLTSKPSITSSDHPLKSTWIVWYRPPTSKYSDYEKSTIPLAHFATVEAFWTVYSHLKRPSALPSVSDYHIFKKGIRPVWEDEENKRGGKWIIRLKKGVADRYWEDLLFAIVGDQFAEAGEEVCGAVLSIRSGEDVLSVWTRIDGGRNIKIRETIKRLLAFPADTNIVWKSHDDSIAQRSAIDQARHEKGGGNGSHHTQSKRRETINEDSAPEKARPGAA